LKDTVYALDSTTIDLCLSVFSWAPFRPGHVWSIMAKLQLEHRTRDLALFNLALDSKFGAAISSRFVWMTSTSGYAVDRANVRQKKTGRPVRLELSEVVRAALDDSLRARAGNAWHYLSPGRRGPDFPLTTRVKVPSARLNYLAIPTSSSCRSPSGQCASKTEKWTRA